MGKALTKEEFINRLTNRENFLYRVSSLATDRDDYTSYAYDFIIQNELTEDGKSLKNINTLTRKNTYQTKHEQTSKEKSNREEERFVLDMFNNRNQTSYQTIFGEILDYQVPLKNFRSDKGVGKIDFIFKKDNALYFAEIKTATNKESILKAITEIQTYYQIADKEKLLEDYKLDKNLLIKKCLVLFEESVQVKRLLKDERIKDLISRFNIVICILSQNSNIEQVLLSEYNNI